MKANDRAGDLLDQLEPTAAQIGLDDRSAWIAGFVPTFDREFSAGSWETQNCANWRSSIAGGLTHWQMRPMGRI
jgi:hypothetical protein